MIPDRRSSSPTFTYPSLSGTNRMVPSSWAIQQRVNVPAEVTGATASIPVAVLDSTISLLFLECQHPTNSASVAGWLTCAGGDGSGLAVFSNECVGGREGAAADASLSVEAAIANSACDGCGVGLTLPMPNRPRQAGEENSSGFAPSAKAKNPARDSGNHRRRLSFPPRNRVRQ